MTTSPQSSAAARQVVSAPSGQGKGQAQQGKPEKSLLAAVQSWVTGRLTSRSNGDIRQSLEDIVATDVTSGAASGLGDDERTMIRNILSYHEVRVDDVMVPRADITAFEESGSFKELVTLFLDAAHSRIPVYQETLDNVVGMIHIKDVVKPLTRDLLEMAQAGEAAKHQDPQGLLRSVLFVPPSMRVIDLLARMRAARVHMAIVVDEYGGTDGLVTIEDLVEEIVGEIEDEHDEHEPDPLVFVEEGVWLADARIPIDDLEAAVDLKLVGENEDMDVDTLGGLVFSISGKVPIIGEQVSHDAGLVFEVIDGDPRRITRVRITRASEETGSA